MRILVVEDERALYDAIARSLRNLAYSVDCCHDGQQARDLLDVETFDLVVLDLNLPRVDGMTVLRQLRKTDCETKVLVLSARGEVADKVARSPTRWRGSMPAPTTTSPSRSILMSWRRASVASRSGASRKTVLFSPAGR